MTINPVLFFYIYIELDVNHVKYAHSDHDNKFIKYMGVIQGVTKYRKGIVSSMFWSLISSTVDFANKIKWCMYVWHE